MQSAGVDAVDLVKWLAFIAMIVDHIGGLVLKMPFLSWPYQVGRLSFPLFAIVLGWKLAQRHLQGADSVRRQARSLWMWALLSQLPFALASGRMLPPNIFLTLWLGVLGCALSLRPIPSDVGGRTLHVMAWLGLAVAGGFADYGASGVLLMVAVFRYVLNRSWFALVAILLMTGGLALGNKSWWTFLAMPIAMIGMRWPLPGTTSAATGAASAATETAPAAMGAGTSDASASSSASAGSDASAASAAYAAKDGSMDWIRRHAFHVFYPMHLAAIGGWRWSQGEIDLARLFRPGACWAAPHEQLVDWLRCML